MHLLEAGADASLSDKMGLSPLFGAAYRSNAALVRLLLEKKADAAAKAINGQSIGQAMIGDPKGYTQNVMGKL